MTKRDRIKEKERRAKRLAKQRQESLDAAEREELLDAEELPEDTPEPAPLVKGMERESEMLMPPTSFEELDALRAAQETAEQVEEVTWDVRNLVGNILYSGLLEPSEKAEKIRAVAGGFEERVQAALGEELEKDLDVLQIQAILAMEDRRRSLFQKGWESVAEFAKRELTARGRQALADSEFALPEKRKYPINDKAHVRNALARAAQQIKAGGEAAEDARKALPKIRAAAKKMGIESMEKGIHIEKDAKGDWRWIGRPSNNFVDWQNDIMTRQAHADYCAWLDANPEFAPVFMKWHTPGTARTHPVDFWMEHEGALIMSGILTEGEAAELLRLQKQADLGMSVQGLGLRQNPADPREITTYWLYEVSDLPLDAAANPFTSLETITKEAGMDKLQYLTEMMGSREKAEAFLQKTGQMQKNLQEAGLTSKEKAPEAAVETPAADAAPATPAPATFDAEAFMKRLKDELDIEGLNAFVAQAQADHDKVEILEAVIQELQKTKDEQVAESLTPPAMRLAWARKNRPSQSPETTLKKGKPGEEEGEDELLSKAQPNAHWLSEVTNTAPVAAEV